MARNYSNISPELALSSGVNSAVTTITVDGDPVVAADFVVVVSADAQKATEEVMLVTGVADNLDGTFDLTVTRGYDGSTARAHGSGASVSHAVAAIDLVELYTYVAANDAGTLGGLAPTAFLRADQGGSIAGHLTVNGTGSRNYFNSGHVRLSDDYAVEWGGAAVYVKGSNAAGTLSLAGNATLTGSLAVTSHVRATVDSAEVSAGASNDVRMYHDGIDSWVNNATGILNMRSAGAVYLGPGGTNKWQVSAAGDFLPFATGYDIGASGLRAGDVFAASADLSGTLAVSGLASVTTSNANPLLTLQNNSVSGFSAILANDTAGTWKMGVGFANSSVGAPRTSSAYLSTNTGVPFVITVPGNTSAAALVMNTSGHFDFQSGNITTAGEVLLGAASSNGYQVNVATSDNKQFWAETTGTDRVEVYLNKNSGTARAWALAVAGSTNGHGVTDRSFYIVDVSASAERYVIDVSGNHDFQAGNITTTGTLASGVLTVTGNITSSDAVIADYSMRIGTTPATAGHLRMPKGMTIAYRNAANTANINAIYAHPTTDDVYLGGDYVDAGNTYIRSANAIGITLDSSQKATFSADVTIAAGTNSNLIVTSNSTSGAARVRYENSGDANNAWATLRKDDGTFAISMSTGAGWGSGTTTYPVTVDTSGRLGVGNAPTAYVDAAASTTGVASLRLRSGVAPTTPNAGDLWYDGTDFKGYDGTDTVSFGGGGGGGGSISVPFNTGDSGVTESGGVYIEGATKQAQRHIYLDAGGEGAVAMMQIPDGATTIDALYVWAWYGATAGAADFGVWCIDDLEAMYSNASVDEDNTAWKSGASSSGFGDLIQHDVSSLMSGIWAAGDTLIVSMQYPVSGGSGGIRALYVTLEWS